MLRPPREFLIVQEDILKLETKFLSWIDWNKVTSLDSCWNFTSKICQGGYCQFQIGRTPLKRKAILVGAHRFSYWLYNVLRKSAIESFDKICHSCDNPSCVNPMHLFEGTQKENLQDSVRKHRIGKLTSEDILKIKQYKADGCSIKAIANTFKISERHTRHILAGQRYGALNLF